MKELNPRRKKSLPTRLVRGGALRADDVGMVSALANTCQLTGPDLEAFLFDNDPTAEAEFKDSVNNLEDLSVVSPEGGVCPTKGSGRRPRPTGAMLLVSDPNQLSLFDLSKQVIVWLFLLC